MKMIRESLALSGRFFSLILLVAILTPFAARSCFGADSQAPNKKQIAEATFQAGFRQFQLKDYASALNEFEKALELQPDHIKSLFFKAVIFDRQEDYQKSVSAYDTFLKAKPNEPTALSNLGTALYHTGRWPEALQSVEKALMVKADPNVLHNKGNLLLMMAEYEKAIPILEQAKRSGARIPDALLTAERDIARQFIGKDLPSDEWRPDYSKYLSMGRLSDENRVISFPRDPGTSFSFEGSERMPFHLLTNLDVWDGAINHDPARGILLSPGTKFKQVRMKNGQRVIVVGHITNWKAIVDKVEPVGVTAIPESKGTQPKRVKLNLDVRYTSIIGDPQGLKVVARTIERVVTEMLQGAGFKVVAEIADSAYMTVDIKVELFLNMTGSGLGGITIATNVDSPDGKTVVSQEGYFKLDGKIRLLPTNGRAGESSFTGQAKLMDPEYAHYDSKSSPAFVVACGSSDLVSVFGKLLTSEVGTDEKKTLLAALKDRSWLIRNQAFEGLFRLGLKPENAENDIERSYMLLTIGAFEECSRLGDVGIPALLTGLEDDFWPARGAATDALIKAGKTAVKSLTGVLNDEERSSRARCLVIEILVRIGDTTAVTPLIDTLQSSDVEIQERTAWALGEFRDAQAYPYLAELSKKSPNEAVRRKAVEALEKIKRQAK